MIERGEERMKKRSEKQSDRQASGINTALHMLTFQT